MIKYTKEIESVISKCITLFDNNNRHQVKQMSAQAPVLTGLPKSTRNMPIQPLINYTCTPGYKGFQRYL